MKTLSVAIQALIGTRLTIELRNEINIEGELDSCDINMNLVVTNGSVKARNKLLEKSFTLMFISTKNIKYIHIPNHINIFSAVSANEQMKDRIIQKYSRSRRK